MKRVSGSAVFFAALIVQTLVLVLFFCFPSKIGYLWYNLGCAAVLLLAWVLQKTLFRHESPPPAR
jgi:bacteriorhodopsin